MAKVGFTYDDSRLRSNIRNMPNDIRSNIRAVVDYNSAYAVGYLKTKARWTDRTGAARSGLTAIPFERGNTFGILMAYSVTYGIWLEVANDRKYAIITPATRIIGEKLMKDLEYMLSRI